MFVQHTVSTNMSQDKAPGQNLIFMHDQSLMLMQAATNTQGVANICAKLCALSDSCITKATMSGSISCSSNESPGSG